MHTDEYESVRRAVGGWVREADKTHEDRLVAFLETHAAEMPATMVRYATEKLDDAEIRDL